jgi:hypothetical protein
LRPLNALRSIRPFRLRHPRIVTALLAMFPGDLISAIQPSHFPAGIGPAIFTTIGMPVLLPDIASLRHPNVIPATATAGVAPA